jgi:LAS superfamily LD-carboxypeptidase LdcB
MMLRCLADVPTYAYILIALGVVVVIVVLILVLFPNLRPQVKKETHKEIVSKEVSSLVVDPEAQRKKDITLSQDIRKDKKVIAEKEQELNLVFTPEDVDALLVQMEQDRRDDHEQR